MKIPFYHYFQKFFESVGPVRAIEDLLDLNLLTKYKGQAMSLSLGYAT